jgi:hypothetical protein
VREEHPIWKAGSAKVLAARARAAERSSTPSPKINVATAALTDVALKPVGAQDVAAVAADAEADRRAVMLDAAERFADGLRSTRALAIAVAAESLTQHTVDAVAPGDRPDQATDLAGLQTLVTLDEAHRARVQAQLHLCWRGCRRVRRTSMPAGPNSTSSGGRPRLGCCSVA